jgi:hypothetical protein
MNNMPLQYFCLGLMLATLPAPDLIACDVDKDCGVGVCIKREKRASGICYGLELNTKQKNKAQSARSKAIDLMGDPNEILKRHFPGKEIGELCIISTDCNEGQECVHAGFEGRCITL